MLTFVTNSDATYTKLGSITIGLSIVDTDTCYWQYAYFVTDSTLILLLTGY